MQTKFSVIISTYNRFAYMTEAIESVLAQTYPAFEICLVDDGSSPPIADQWQDTKFAKADHISLTTIPDLGPSAARNAGAAIATGDYFVFLDDDDLFVPTYLEKLDAAITETNPEVIVSWLRCFDENTTWSGKHFPINHLDMNPYRKNIGFVGSNICVKKDAYQQIDGFDANLQGSEDKDFYIRLRQAGFTFQIMQEELINYRVHSSEQASGQYRFHPFQVSGKYLFLQKHGQDMDKATFRYLKNDAAFFRLMGSKNTADRKDGFMTLLKSRPTSLLFALYVIMKKAIRK